MFSLYLELSIKSNSRNKEKIQSRQFYPNFIGFYGIIKISKMVFVKHTTIPNIIKVKSMNVL